MARTDPQINVRLPQELKDKLDEAALEEKRSLTAEVIARLEKSFWLPAMEQSFRAEIDKQMDLVVQMERLLHSNRALGAANDVMVSLLHMVAAGDGKVSADILQLIARFAKTDTKTRGGFIELAAEWLSAHKDLEEFRRDPLHKLGLEGQKELQDSPAVQRARERYERSKNEDNKS